MSWTSTRSSNRSPRAGTEGSRDLALDIKQFYGVLFLLMTSFFRSLLLPRMFGLMIYRSV